MGMIDEISAICTDNGIPLEKSDKIIQKLAYKKNTYAIGVFQKYYPVLSEEGNHVVLVEPRNMGNIGTVVRTMVGFGIKDLALVRPAADIFDPKVIRSAMGSLFRINFEYFDTFEDYYLKHMNHSMYPFIVHGGRKIKQIAVEKPFSLIFGNESRGLDRTYTTVGQPVYIPQTNEVDSLNLSIAAGIAMWYFASITGY